MAEEEKKVFDFETSIKPVFNWIGVICAGLLAISYFIGAIILIRGLDQALGTQALVLYAIYNGIMTVLILFSLGIQGQVWARDHNKDIVKRLNDLKPKKEKKIHSMTFYWCTQAPIKIIMKVGWAIFSTLAVTTVFLQGNGDYSLLLMIAMNIILSAGTGLLFCSKTYDYYNDNQVPLMKQEIELLESRDSVNAKEAKDDSL